jgi:hypothetical protein
LTQQFWKTISSELPIGPKWLTETSNFPSCRTLLHFKILVCQLVMKGFWNHTHLNKQVCNKKDILC